MPAEQDARADANGKAVHDSVKEAHEALIFDPHRNLCGTYGRFDSTRMLKCNNGGSRIPWRRGMMNGDNDGQDRPIVRTNPFSKLLFALAVSWPLSHAGAATLDGQVLPDTYRVDDQTLTLNGIGLRTLTIFRVKAYIAGLYLRQPNHDPQQILSSPGTKVLLLKFVHGASKERVERQYRAGEKDNCGSGGCDPKDEPDFEHLVAAAPAVEPGDTTTYIINGNYVRVLANDRLIDEFRNRDLAFQLLAGFIGDHPPTPLLRRQLLGLPEE